jgi:hypothetical protein
VDKQTGNYYNANNKWKKLVIPGMVMVLSGFEYSNYVKDICWQYYFSGILSL